MVCIYIFIRSLFVTVLYLDVKFTIASSSYLGNQSQKAAISQIRVLICKVQTRILQIHIVNVIDANLTIFYLSIPA